MPTKETTAMSITLIEHLRDKLIEYGAVKSSAEFCRCWLGRSEGYIRTLRHHQIDASIDALAVCASKLAHYAERLAHDDSEDHCRWRDRFERLQALCEVEIERQAAAQWQQARQTAR
jgi:hypothetical protein